MADIALDHTSSYGGWKLYNKLFQHCLSNTLLPMLHNNFSMQHCESRKEPKQPRKLLQMLSTGVLQLPMQEGQTTSQAHTTSAYYLNAC
jgi:hypothetical protein